MSFRVVSFDATAHIRKMRKSDVTCPECNAGYRRVELTSKAGTKGEFHCLICNHLLEVFDGSTDIAIRLTVQPEKIFE
jgi:transposase-like protein